MRGELGAAAIERQGAPAAAERRDAAVAVLQVEQPANPARGGPTSLVAASRPRSASERAGRVVGVRHAAAEGVHAQRSGRGVRVTDARACSAGRAASRAACAARRRRPRSALPPAASAPIDSVVTHVARFVSIGQLPSSRIESTQETARRCSTTGLLAAAACRARLITTKLVSGVASRIAAALGCISRSTRMRPRRERGRAAGARRVARRREVMAHLADRDQRRQRVAHDRQPQVLKPGVRQRGQLERQLRNRSPAPASSVAQLAGERQHREDRHRERLVLAVAARDRGAQRVRRDVAGDVARSHASACAAAARGCRRRRDASTAPPRRSPSC